MFELSFSTDSDAFDDGENGALEVARILRAVADQLEHESRHQSGAYDFNGNRIGTWRLT